MVNALEIAPCMFLNEVLSLNAQELVFYWIFVLNLESSMKS